MTYAINSALGSCALKLYNIPYLDQQFSQFILNLFASLEFTS